MTRNNSQLIHIENITKIYGQGQNAMRALGGVSLDIHQGEFVAMMGPSGSGKSTCLNIIGCLDTPSSGIYQFDKVEVNRLSRNQRALLRKEFLGFVFQGFNLLSRTSALENVELPLIYRKIPAKTRHRLALEALEAVGLEKWYNHTPAELSGGQQQRVAIARAIVGKPKILLADEPTGNLDSTRSVEIMEMMRRINKEEGITVVMVTHEPDMAEYAHRQIHFQDGRIISDIKTEALSC